METQRNSGLLIVISSPSGAGKTSICKRLLKENNKINVSISDTTRAPRDNEINGNDYNFISENEFEISSSRVAARIAQPLKWPVILPRSWNGKTRKWMRPRCCHGDRRS